MIKRVMVIHSNRDYDSNDTPFPPIGTVGDVVLGLDEYDEYEINFPGHPCPTLDGPEWITHKNMIVFIDEDKIIQKEKELCLTS